jgi:hypothetical protein
MGIISKPLFSIGEIVIVKSVSRQFGAEEWAGSIQTAYWDEKKDGWQYKITRRSNFSVDTANESQMSRIKVKSEVATKVTKYNMWDMQVAKGLEAMIVQNNPKANVKPMTEAALEAWAEDFRKMREIDNIDHADIAKVLQWSQQDVFWRKNILSASKFRQQYKKLSIAAITEGRTKSPF